MYKKPTQTITIPEDQIVDLDMIDGTYEELAAPPAPSLPNSDVVDLDLIDGSYDDLTVAPINVYNAPLAPPVKIRISPED